MYRVCYIAVLASAVFLKLEAIWALADIVNGLMAVPNLIALLGLSGVIVSETKKYFGHLEIRDARLAAYKERRIGKRWKDKLRENPAGVTPAGFCIGEVRVQGSGVRRRISSS